MEDGMRKKIGKQEDFFLLFLIHDISVSHSQISLSKRTVSTDRTVGASFPICIL